PPGLPPGPICNPGLSSLDAALAPAPESYLYFVARGDGSHRFSRTLGEHLDAVEKFRALKNR
ncbi:MAG TPA: endolytic transglycosylase MltG, partial [Acidobacteriota bacterium]|nr:endolytic transglycosylase MltG [Acidobacteriota bacterium]